MILRILGAGLVEDVLGELVVFVLLSELGRGFAIVVPEKV